MNQKKSILTKQVKMFVMIPEIVFERVFKICNSFS